MATIKLRDYLLALSSKGSSVDGDIITILDSADGNTIKTVLKSDLVDLDYLVSELQDDFLDQFGEGTFSGSAQVDHDATTNFDANEHIDHTAVSIIAGAGLTGGGDISSDRTINIVSDNNGIVVDADQIELDTDSSTFSGGVLTKMNIEQVVSGSSQISADQTDGWVSDVKTQLNSNTVISGSSQVILNDADKTGFDTADVVEGTNLYYTDARVLSKINTEGVISGSTFSSPSQGTLTTTINGVSSNVDLGLQSGDNVTFVDGTFTGNVSINGNLDVLGDAVEIQTSELRVEDKLITVASGSADSAASDGSGLEIDGANKSLKWNHSTQQFVFDAKVSSSVGFKGEGGELTGIDTDQVTEAGNLYYTDARVKTKLNTEGVISGSSQIDVTQTSNYSSINQYTDSDNTSHLNSLGVVSGSSQIDHDQTTNFSADEHFTQANITTVGTVTTGNVNAILPTGTVSGSSQIDVTQTTNYGSINQYTDSDNTSHLNSLGVVSGSSQIDVTQTTNYSSINQYTDSDNLSYLNSLLVVSKSADGDLLIESGNISLKDDYTNIIIGSGSSADNNQPYTSDNVVIGRNINPTSNTTAKNENVLVGNDIGFPRGTDNTFIGHGIRSLGGDFTTTGNTIIGNGAGKYIGGGNYNVIIGLNAATDGTTLTNGDKNTFIGALSSTSANANQQHSIVIGYSADSKGDNTTYIGTPGQTTHTYLEGVITGSSLDVSGDITASSAEFTDTLSVGTTELNNRVFRVYGSGDVAQFTSTNPGVGGAQIDITHESATPADGDNVGIINFGGFDTGLNATQYANVKAIASSVASEIGELHFGTRQNSSTYNGSSMVLDGDGNLDVTGTVSGSAFTVASSGAQGIVLNPDSNDSNNSGRLFFLRTSPASSGYAIFNNSNILSFRSGSIPGNTSGVEIMRLQNNGDLTLQTGDLVIGTAGKGINFSATSDGSGTSTSEVLDDYEEGTWTGTLKGSTTDPSTAVTATGYYTKIGNQVTAQLAFTNVDTTGAAGSVTVTGLPYASNSNNNSHGAVMSKLFDFNGGTSLVALLGGSVSEISFLTSTDDADWNDLLHNAGTNRSLRFTLTYFV